MAADVRFVTARGLHRGRIIKMVTRANKRFSKGFYKDLNDVSIVDFSEESTSSNRQKGI